MTQHLSQRTLTSINLKLVLRLKSINFQVLFLPKPLTKPLQNHLHAHSDQTATQLKIYKFPHLLIDDKQLISLDCEIFCCISRQLSRVIQSHRTSKKTDFSRVFKILETFPPMTIDIFLNLFILVDSKPIWDIRFSSGVSHRFKIFSVSSCFKKGPSLPLPL